MRHTSIDLLRAVAIVLMVLVHFLENLAGAAWVPAGFGAPLFAFLAGVSFRIWLNSQEKKGVDGNGVTRVAVRRGLFLFALGFAFNVLVWLPEDTFNWDVLTMIGTVLVFLGVGRNLPSVVLGAVAGTLVVLSPFLRTQADYLSYWQENYFQCEWTLSDVTVGYLATGYFPLFPWAAFPIAGYLAGRVAFPDSGEGRVKPLATTGGCLVLTAVLFDVGHRLLPAPVSTKLLSGWTMFPASPQYVCGTLGGALLAFAGLRVWVDERKWLAKWGSVTSLAGTMSRHSLSIYLFHHILHLWPLWLVGAVVGDEPTAYWRQAMPAWAAVALVPPCLATCYLTFSAAERWKWPTVEGFMRWLCG
jgi:uncharacterized membrane protein